MNAVQSESAYSVAELLDFSLPVDLRRLLLARAASINDAQQWSNASNRRALYELHRELYDALLTQLPDFRRMRLDMPGLTSGILAGVFKGERVRYEHLYLYGETQVVYEIISLNHFQIMRARASSLSYDHQRGVIQQLILLETGLYLVHRSHSRFERGQVRGTCGKPPHEPTLAELVTQRRKLKLLTTPATSGTF